MSRARAAAAAAAVLALTTSCTLGPMDLAARKPLALRSTIVAADGTVLARLYKQNRELVPIRRMPRVLVDAVVAAEDARFFQHPGFDVRSIARAALANLEAGEVVQGGSTITQQYVKNTYFRRPARTLERKARELRLAIEVERRFSKREILERYLNTVYFGEGAYGVKAAAETYFGHDLRALTLKEAALLAGVIRAPTAYDPRVHPRLTRRRRHYVLDRMAATGALSPRRARRAARSELGVTPEPPRPSSRRPYFVEAVRQEMLRDRRLGSNPEERDRLLHEGGLRVETTLEPRLQSIAERAVSEVLDAPAEPHAALVAIRPRTGHVAAMIGGRDWSSSQVNLALGRRGGGSGRQPGSSFKPIVAATAMEAGITLDTTYSSAPGNFTLSNGRTWPVGNAEGHGYGPMTLGEALVRSVNGVFARAALELGAGQIATQAQLMGVRSRLPAAPAIALGAGEVSVLDMAAAYATLANGGTALEPTTIEGIRTASGRRLTTEQEVVEGALSPSNAYLLSRTLEQVIERGTGVLADIGRPAAGKTGTTNDYADAWFVGYTPQLVTAVWVGHPQGRIPMTSVHGLQVMGGTYPAMIWGRFMRAALEHAPVREFTVPSSEYVTVEIDPRSGLLAAEWCPGKEKRILRPLVPTETCPQPEPPQPPPPPAPRPEPTPSPTPVATPQRVRQRSEAAPQPTPTPKDARRRS